MSPAMGYGIQGVAWQEAPPQSKANNPGRAVRASFVQTIPGARPSRPEACTDLTYPDAKKSRGLC